MSLKSVAVCLLLFSSFCSSDGKEVQVLDHGGVKYAFEQDMANLDQVSDWCRDLRGHLPSIHSHADLDFMHKLILGTGSTRGHVFLGAQPNGTGWRWDDGTAMDFNLNSTTETCAQDRTYHKCAPAVNAFVGRPWDKTIVTPYHPYAMTSTKLCKLNPDSPLLTGRAAASSGGHAIACATGSRRLGLVRKTLRLLMFPLADRQPC